MIFLIIILLFLTIPFYFIYKNTNENDKETFNNNFKMYMVNLDRRRDRYDKTIKALEEYGYDNIIRFPAVDGKSLSPEYVKKIVVPEALEPVYEEKRTEHHQLSIGAIGCYLSHINLWSLMIKEHLDYILIFEDDTKPNKTYEYLTSCIEELPDDWDIFTGGGLYTTENKINDKICKISSFYCTHVYFIRNTQRIRKILEVSLPMSKQIDSWMSDLQTEGNLNIYGLTDNSWMQLGDDTDIQTPMM